jgi:putative addiction module killer protein
VELRYYQTWAGRQPFAEWLDRIADRQVRAKIDARLTRVAAGNFGDVEPVGQGVSELRIDWGPGYRIYFGQLGQAIVLLLCGGDKRTQQRDIERAKEYFEDYKKRIAQRQPRGRA